jgi:hypothetical protein
MPEVCLLSNSDVAAVERDARLRGSAEGEVKAAIPGLARLIGRYLESGGDASPGPGRR